MHYGARKDCPKKEVSNGWRILRCDLRETSMKVDIDCRRFPNFKEIVLVYLQSRKASLQLHSMESSAQNSRNRILLIEVANGMRLFFACPSSD
jgi:hypothetical protein